MSDDREGWRARLFVLLQYALPRHPLSRLMYGLARVRWHPLKTLLIRSLLWSYPIDMGDAARPDPGAYPSLNAFFTRALRPGARPLDPDPRAVLSPVDGRISRIGAIRNGRIIQAKGQDFSLEELLGGDAERAKVFRGGLFATLYLAPHDYHRIHMPLTGTLDWMRYLPGRLFSVNGTTAAQVPRLFARNERVLCGFGTDAGAMAMVLVGAIFVGGIETVWAGEITPARYAATATRRDTPDGVVRLERGAEMGRFNLGSTVILLFEPGRVTWAETLVPGRLIRLGERLGTFT